MGWLKRIWLYGFGPLELVDEEDGEKYYATRSLKRCFRSVERSDRKYAKRYPHRFRYVEEPADPVHRPMDSYRYRRDVKDMRASGTDGSLIDRAVSILARGDCLSASFDERYTFTDRRDMRDCRVGGGWRLIYCCPEKTLVLVGLRRSRAGDFHTCISFPIVLSLRRSEQVQDSVRFLSRTSLY